MYDVCPAGDLPRTLETTSQSKHPFSCGSHLDSVTSSNDCTFELNRTFLKYYLSFLDTQSIQYNLHQVATNAVKSTTLILTGFIQIELWK